MNRFIYDNRIAQKMANLESFEQFFTQSSAPFDITSLILALVLSAGSAYLLSKIYIKYGVSLSNKQKFASNFVLLTLTTTLVISIVKSSLALSLGLVGALSIVRFRAAIKEPEELLFLFVSIALGLGFGAGQFIPTLISFVIILIAIVVNTKLQSAKQEHNMNLVINMPKNENVDIKKISSILSNHAIDLRLKRFDSNSEMLEPSFFVTFKSIQELEKAKAELEKLSKGVKITYLDRS